MSNFATIRQTKVKSSDQHNSLNAHNQRRMSSKNIVKENTHKNITLSPSAYKNFDSFVSAKKKAIRDSNKLRKKGEKKARFPREVFNKKINEKGLPALSQEFIFSHSHKALTEEQSISYLKRADEFLREWFSDCEVLSSVIHLDEKTPHLHFHISYFDKVQNRFVQKALSQVGKTDIDIIREAFQKAVANDFDLIKQDGSVVENHETKADLEKSELKDKIADLEKKVYTGKTVTKTINKKIRGRTKRIKVSEHPETWEERARAEEEKNVAAQTLLKEKTQPPQKVEVEKIVKVEDTAKIVALEAVVAKQKAEIADKDTKIASLKQSLKTLLTRIGASVSNFFNSVEIKELKQEANSELKSTLQAQEAHNELGLSNPSMMP